MPGLLQLTLRDSNLIMPEVMLAFFGLGILLTDFLLGPREKMWNALTAMLGVAFSGVTLWELRPLAQSHEPRFNDAIVIDPFFIFFGFIFLAAAALVILISVRYLDIEDEHHGEYYALMLFATVGMMFLACGNDLVTLFIALETMAISFYVLTGFLRRDRRSNEGAMKYVLLGAFSSGILAYGFSLLYGISGSTNLECDCGLSRAAPAGRFAGGDCDSHGFCRSVLQSRGRAFPSVGAGRVRRRADSDHGLRERRVEYGQLRAAAALVPRRFLAGARGLDAADHDGGGAVAHGRETWPRSRRRISSGCWPILRSATSAISCWGSWREMSAGLQAMSFYLFVYAFFQTGAFAIVIVLRRKGVIGDEIDDLNGLSIAIPARPC